MHAVPSDRLAALPSVFDRSGGLQKVLAGRSRRGSSLAGGRSPPRWRCSPIAITGQATSSGETESSRASFDWSGAARGPRGFDVGWCRLDLALLFDERIADVFLAAYEDAIGLTIDDMALWDGWAVARSYDRSKPGLRTTRRSGALTSPDRSFDDATRDGQRGFWNGHKQAPDWGERRLRLFAAPLWSRTCPTRILDEASLAQAAPLTTPGTLRGLRRRRVDDWLRGCRSLAGASVAKTRFGHAT